MDFYLKRRNVMLHAVYPRKPSIAYTKTEGGQQANRQGEKDDVKNFDPTCTFDTWNRIQTSFNT